MATKQRKARTLSSNESPAETKRRTESASTPDEGEAAVVKSKGKGKGKRGNSEGEEDDVEELFKEPIEDGSDREDKEDQEEFAPKKKKAGKQKKGGDMSPSKSRPKAPKAKSKRKEDNPDDAIFERVKLPNAATVAIVNDWVKQYRNDQRSLTRDLINFVLQSAGSPGSVSAARFESGDISGMITELAEDVKYKEEGGDYPLVSRAKALKKFRANYADFWNKLIIACARSWIFDDYFVDELDSWLSEISGSVCRPFRHAATVAAMEIVAALSAVAAALTKERKVAHAQLTIEKKKKNETAAQLEKQVLEIDVKIAKLEKMVEGFFEGIFVHRYRDTGPDIRVASTAALGRWVTIHPDHFLKDGYLKYLAWTLYDRVPEVRLAALRGLHELYRECIRDTETTEEKARKKLFGDRIVSLTERFRARMVEMAYDKDATVAAEAIEVCQCLSEVEMLEKHDIAKIIHLVTDDSAALREAVAKFVADQLKRAGGRQSKPDAVRTLTTFVVEQSQIPDRPEYVVDALWSTDYAAVKDWAAMAELMAEQGSQQLSALEHVVLVRILSCSVRKAMGVAIVPKEKPEKAEKASAREAQQKELTKALMKSLPSLIKAFQADGDIVTELVQIVPHFPLEDFRGQRQVGLAKDLLRLMREVFFLHTSAEVHGAVGRAFKALLAAESSVYSEVDVAFHELTQQLHDKLEASLATVLKGQNDAEEDDEGHQFSLALALQRLHELLISIRVPQAEFAGSLDRVLEARTGKLLPKHKAASQIIGAALKAQALLLQWDVAGLGEEPASDRKKLQGVKERRDALVEQLKKLISTGSTEQRTDAYFALLDLLVVFSPAMRGTTAEVLVYEADGDVNTHVQEHAKAVMALSGSSEEEEQDLLELKECVLLALGRGLLFNTLNDAAATQVALQLTQAPKSLLDIARSFVSQWRDRKSGRKDYDIFFEAIKQLYEAGAHADDGGGKEEGEGKGFKLLCSRIAMSYGVAASRLRESLIHLIRAVILFGLQQTDNLAVLSGVNVLANRLPHAEDARYMLTTLDEAVRKAGVEVNKDDAAHRPLWELRALLDRRARGIKGKEAKATAAEEGDALPVKKRGAPKKKRNILELKPVEPVVEKEKAEIESIEKQSKRPRKKEKSDAESEDHEEDEEVSEKVTPNKSKKEKKRASS